MSDAQKIPLARSLNQFAEKKIYEALQITGRALPCSVTAVTGSIVTVKFEMDDDTFTIPSVTIPLFGPEFIRYPLQVGCKGVCFPVDARIGGMSGLGSGAANFAPPANLTALVFMPIGNKSWTAPIDPSKTEIYGPDGVIVRSNNSQAKIDTTDNGVVISFGAVSLTINSSGFHFSGGDVAIPSNSITAQNVTGTTEVTAGVHPMSVHHHAVSGGSTGGPLP